MRATASCGEPLLPSLRGTGLRVCPWKQGLSPLRQRQHPSWVFPKEPQTLRGLLPGLGGSCSPRLQTSVGTLFWEKWHQVRGKLWICKTPAGLAFHKHALRNGAKAGSSRDLQDTAAARSTTGMRCILLLDTGGLCLVRNAALICSALAQPGADRTASRSHVSAVISGRMVFAWGCF